MGRPDVRVHVSDSMVGSREAHRIPVYPTIFCKFYLDPFPASTSVIVVSPVLRVFRRSMRRLPESLWECAFRPIPNFSSLFFR